MTATSHRPTARTADRSSAAGPAVVAVDPRTDPRWLRLCRGSRGNLFTSPAWLRAVCRSFGLAAHARVALDPAGAPVGGFCWLGTDDVRGRRRSSLPFSDRADPPVHDAATWSALLAAAHPDAEPLTVRCLDDSPALGDPRLRPVGEAAWHGTHLGPHTDVEALHRRISSTSRRNIAAAARAGVQVQVRDDLDALHTFHRMHVRLRKQKYRMLAQPVTFFEDIRHELGSYHCRTLLAVVDGEVIAGALFCQWNDVLYYKFGASTPARLRLRPNDAIYWVALQLALQRGLRLVDWGRSDTDQPGLLAFKRKWASTERRLLTLRAGPEPVEPPARRRLDHDLTELTRLFTDPAVPDEVTARAGAVLYRYFS